MPALTATEAEPFTSLFNWHPSEATGLWTAAACGHRGTVEIRAAGLPVILTDATPSLCAISTGKLIKSNIFAEPLTRTKSLNEIEGVVRTTRGSTELDYERRKAARAESQTAAPNTSIMISRITQLSEDTSERVEFLTVRRVAEVTGYPSKQFEQFSKILRTTTPGRFFPPLWRVH
jgi:hypothetical protein